MNKVNELTKNELDRLAGVLTAFEDSFSDGDYTTVSAEMYDYDDDNVYVETRDDDNDDYSENFQLSRETLRDESLTAEEKAQEIV